MRARSASWLLLLSAWALGNPCVSAEPLADGRLTIIVERDNGTEIARYPALAGAIQALPSVESCEGLTIREVSDLSGDKVADVKAHMAAYLRARPDKHGCELVVLKARYTEHPVDPLRDPRVRHLEPGQPLPEDDSP